jgi:hypothetical protein
VRPRRTGPLPGQCSVGADDLETYLENPDPDPRLRNTSTKTAAMLARNIAEELGLPTRTVMVPEQSTYDYRINGVDIEALMRSWQEPSEHGMPGRKWSRPELGPLFARHKFSNKQHCNLDAKFGGVTGSSEWDLMESRPSSRRPRAPGSGAAPIGAHRRVESRTLSEPPTA